MKLIRIILLLIVFFSNITFAQSDKIQFDYIPSYSMNLDHDFTLLSLPSRTTEYTPVITNSFYLSYLKSIKNNNYLKIGLGLFTTGHKASYSQDPPIYFSGRTDILKATFIQIPINYIYSIGQFKIEFGISGNILMIEKRILGSGEQGYALYEIPFDTFELGLCTGFYYSFNLSDKIGLNIGVSPHYVITENQFNIGLFSGLGYNIK